MRRNFLHWQTEELFGELTEMNALNGVSLRAPAFYEGMEVCFPIKLVLYYISKINHYLLDPT